MTKKALFFVGALLSAMSLGACVAQSSKDGYAEQSGTPEAIRLAQMETFVINRSSRAKPLAAGECDPAPGAGCEITIKVGNNCGTNPLDIEVSEEYLAFKKQGAKFIQWRIESNDWEFPATGGIKFYAPGDQLENKGRKSKQEWVYRNKADKKGYFNYEINVVNIRDPAKKCRRDPGIINDW